MVTSLAVHIGYTSGSSLRDNQLVRKHPNVAALYPMRIETAFTEGLFTPGQFEVVTAVLDRADELAADTINALRCIASRGLVLGRGDDVAVLPVTLKRSYAIGRARTED